MHRDRKARALRPNGYPLRDIVTPGLASATFDEKPALGGLGPSTHKMQNRLMTAIQQLSALSRVSEVLPVISESAKWIPAISASVRDCFADTRCIATKRAARMRADAASAKVENAKSVLSALQTQDARAPKVWFASVRGQINTGLLAFRDVTRFQSSPSNRASNCVLLIEITPSRICGHSNPLPSIRL